MLLFVIFAFNWKQVRYYHLSDAVSSASWMANRQPLGIYCPESVEISGAKCTQHTEYDTVLSYHKENFEKDMYNIVSVRAPYMIQCLCATKPYYTRDVVSYYIINTIGKKSFRASLRVQLHEHDHPDDVMALAYSIPCYE